MEQTSGHTKSKSASTDTAPTALTALTALTTPSTGVKNTQWSVDNSRALLESKMCFNTSTSNIMLFQLQFLTDVNVTLCFSF